MSDGSAFQARDPAMEKVDKEDKVYGSVSQPFLSNAPFIMSERRSPIQDCLTQKIHSN